MEISTTALLQLMFLPLFLLAVVWFARNRKKLPSKWVLFWSRSRAIKVNFLTRSGRNIERIIKPDARGMMHIEGGSYPFLKEASTINAELRIPEVWVSESQPYPAIPDLVEVKVKTLVKKPKEGGGFQEVESEIPGHLVSFHNIRSLKLAGKTAQEIEQMLGSKIVNDIVNATSKQMQRLELMFYITIGIAFLCLVGFFVIHQDVSKLSATVEGVLHYVSPTVSQK